MEGSIESGPTPESDDRNEGEQPNAPSYTNKFRDALERVIIDERIAQNEALKDKLEELIQRAAAEADEIIRRAQEKADGVN